MEGIRRFDHVSYGMVSDSNGEYVTYYECEKVVASVASRAMEQIDSIKAAHEAEIARLRAEIADAHAAIESKAGWEWKREADRLRAEVEKIRGYEVAPMEAKVSGLRAELQNAAKAALDAVALSCEKEREADALRVDAERYRWLRDKPWRDNDELEPVIRLQLNALWDDKIDAAMGASA